MKNNHLWKWAMAALAASLFILKSSANTIQASIQVVNQDGLSLKGAQVSSGSGIKPLTDQNGNAKLEFKKHFSGGRIWVNKEGYYNSETKEYFPMSAEIKNSQTIKIKIKEIKNPVAMYVKDLRGGRFKLPKYDGKPFGYDLIIGDWVAPHGKGKVNDFVFSYKGIEGNVVEVDEWEKKIILSFSNEKDGVIPWDGLSEEGRIYGSKLASDYNAPLNGYQLNWIQRTWKVGGKRHTTIDRNRNFYFRVRSKLDEDGNIVSAHYGKIYSVNEFSRFIYYVNPKPNDRNVEFDPIRVKLRCNFLIISEIYA